MGYILRQLPLLNNITANGTAWLFNLFPQGEIRLIYHNIRTCHDIIVGFIFDACGDEEFITRAK